MRRVWSTIISRCHFSIYIGKNGPGTLSFVANGYSHCDNCKTINDIDAFFRGQWHAGAVLHDFFNSSASVLTFRDRASDALKLKGQRMEVTLTG